MAKEKKTCSVLTLHLRPAIWQAERLDKMYETARKIYNTAVSKRWGQYQQMTRTKRYREIQEGIKNELKRIEEEKMFFLQEEKEKQEQARANGKSYKVKSFKGDKSERLRELYQQRNALLKENGFTEYGFSDMSRYVGPFKNIISSNVASLSIGAPLWKSFSSVIYGKGDVVHYKKYGDFNRLASNGASGIRFRELDGKYYVIIANSRYNTKKMEIPVETFGRHAGNDFTEYERDMMSRKIKLVQIVRKPKGKGYSYWCQLVVDGHPYCKQENGEDKYKINTGVVGLTIWRNELYAVSKDGYKCFNLCPNFETYNEKKRELSTEIEAVRRCNNPDNYNEDGTIKKGLMVDGKRQRLTWHYSNRYKQLRVELRELQRKNAETRNLLQNRIVHELLAMGDMFVMADMSFLTEKPEWDEENPLQKSEYRKKKARRVSIQESAPSMLITKLNTKLSANERPAVVKMKLDEAVYWYHHEKNASAKELFMGDKVKIGNQTCNHTLYRAWLSYHYNLETNGYENCYADEDLLFEELLRM